jgi:hypothetical protein
METPILYRLVSMIKLYAINQRIIVNLVELLIREVLTNLISM